MMLSLADSPPYPAPPSRATNPFATCWTRPGALPWIETGEEELGAIVDRLRAANWRGQIVGPHGAGKSALLHALRQPLAEAGQRVEVIDAMRGTCRFANRGQLVMVEGFERLGRRERGCWLRRASASGVGWLVTTHRPMWSWPSVPVVATVRPGVHLAERLFERLTKDHPTPVACDDVAASFARRRGNLREVWFDLYDLHEQRTRQHRTCRPRGS